MQAEEAVGAVGEVRAVRAGADAAVDPAGGRREKFGVDRSAVIHVCKTAKRGALDALAASVPGRPGSRGKTVEQVELEDARSEIERLRATITEQAVELHLHKGNRVGTETPAPCLRG